MESFASSAEETLSPQAVDTQNAHGSASWVVSLLFWLSLMVAAVLYAAVALSPKLAEWIRVREQFSQNAVRLVRLEENVDYLERVATALESDPEFARRLAQASMPGVSSRLEIVPVTRELLFGGVSDRKSAADAEESQPSPRIQVVRPAFAEAVFHLASHERHRRWLLFAAAAITLFGFTFLNDSESGSLRSLMNSLLWVVSLPARRYRKAALAEQTGDGIAAASGVVPTDSGPDAFSHEIEDTRT